MKKNNNVIELLIEEEITGKARPRMNTKTGKAYTPTKTKNYEYLVRYIFVNKYHDFKPFEKEIHMKITAYFRVPKNVSKLKEAEMLGGIINPTKKPDWDNIGKIICDALNKFAYKDDNQITECTVIKKYSRIPKVKVEIWEGEN